MPCSQSSSRIILEVERAASDLRRGQPVRLAGYGAKPLCVRSGEHHPTEATTGDAAHPAVKLLKLAGLLPTAIVEEACPDKHANLFEVSAKAIEEYPAALATSLEKVSEAPVPLALAQNTRIIAFRPQFGHEEHLAVVVGKPEGKEAPLVRLHSSCVTGDVFGSLRCDCGNQLHKAIEVMHKAGAGVVLYLSQEGRGIGIANKLRAYALQDKGMDTVEANEALGFAPDERNFAMAAEMLKQLGLKRITLLTNNPDKVEALIAQGIDVAKREPLVTEVNEHNTRYIDTKVLKMGHQF